MIAVFAKVNALPDSHVQTSVGDGDGQADATQRRLCMGRHVVGSFQCMLILWTVLWDEAVEDGLHVGPHVWVGILIDAQSATRMLAEYVDDASLWQLGQLSNELARHQMEASRLGGKCYLNLLNHFFQAFTTSPIYME